MGQGVGLQVEMQEGWGESWEIPDAFMEDFVT